MLASVTMADDGDERYNRQDYYDTLEINSLLELLESRRRDVDLLVRIGRYYLYENKLEKTHFYYSKALHTDPNDGWTHLYMGNLFYAIDFATEAESHFKQAIEQLPGFACPYWCLGGVYEMEGYWARAEEYYRKAVEIDPDDAKSKEKLDEWLADKDERMKLIRE